MHTCPNCGMDCDCSGDIDDAQVMTEKWAFVNCQCCGDTDTDDDKFDYCDDCDLPDACSDFGCAIKAGLRPDILRT